MALWKNTDSQKLAIYAYDTSADAPKTGDAGQITARISKDGAAVAQSNDAAPTELDATYAEGVYLFDLTQAETNCDLFILSAESSTGDILIEPVIVYTLPGTNAGVGVVDNDIADAVLKRGISNVEDTADTTSLTALVLATLESSASGTTWTIRKTGGTTFVTKTITLDSGADPITGVT